MSPRNPVNASADGKPYTISFKDTWGDAVRIIGKSGGAALYTAIAELEVYYS